MILDLWACPDSVLQVCSSFRLEMEKVKVLEILTGSGLLISGSNSDSRSWSRSVILNMTYVKNLTSLWVDLIGFGADFRSWKI